MIGKQVFAFGKNKKSDFFFCVAESLICFPYSAVVFRMKNGKFGTFNIYVHKEEKFAKIIATVTFFIVSFKYQTQKILPNNRYIQLANF